MYDSIPICRSVFKHWIYDDAEYLKVWLTMLGRARYLKEPKKIMFEGTLAEVNYGEFIFGYNAWNKNTGVSVQRLRRLIKTLVSDGMIISTVRTNRFTIFSITNYEKFNSQSSEETQGVEGSREQSINSQSTVNQQSANIEITTNEEGNKKVKNVKKVKKDIYSENDELNQAINGFIEMRKSLKKPMTSRAVNMMITKLQKLGSSDQMKIDIVNQSIMCSWTDIYELKQQKLFCDKPKNSFKKESHMDMINDLLAGCQE